MGGQHYKNYDVKWEIVYGYPRNVDRCCTWPDVAWYSRWNLSAFSKFDFVLFCYINGRKDSRVTITLNKETTAFNLQNMFRHSHVIFNCKWAFNGCTYKFYIKVTGEQWILFPSNGNVSLDFVSGHWDFRKTKFTVPLWTSHLVLIIPVVMEMYFRRFLVPGFV